MRIAAIDVGSNSIHMVVARADADGRFEVLDTAKEMVRLGRQSFSTGNLSAEAMNAGVQVLSLFQKLADRHSVERITAVATSAVREARNGGEFVQRVRDELGLRVKVIPGREEARLIFVGVRHALDLRGDPVLIVDAGGGSVEFVLVEDDQAVALDSLKLGVARLTETFLAGDPPSGKELAALDDCLAEQLNPLLDRHAKHGLRRVVGTSGTMLALVSIAAQQRGIGAEMQLNGLEVVAEDISRLRRALVRADRKERLRIKGLETKRADIVVAGACLADHVLRSVRAERMVACTWALREGVLLDFIARHHKRIEEVERFANPRRRDVARLARHLGDMAPHGEHVARLSLRLLDQLRSELALPEEAREWLEYAAILHDIGHHIGHKDHQRHSYYLITNSELMTFRRDELEIVALIARYHRKAPPKDSDDSFAALPKTARRVVREASALLRVADALDRSHYGVVRDVRISRRGGRVLLRLQTEGDDAELEIWEAKRRCALLEDVLGAKVEFETAAGN